MSVVLCPVRDLPDHFDMHRESIDSVITERVERATTRSLSTVAQLSIKSTRSVSFSSEDEEIKTFTASIVSKEEMGFYIMRSFFPTFDKEDMSMDFPGCCQYIFEAMTVAVQDGSRQVMDAKIEACIDQFVPHRSLKELLYVLNQFELKKIAMHCPSTFTHEFRGTRISVIKQVCHTAERLVTMREKLEDVEKLKEITDENCEQRLNEVKKIPQDNPYRELGFLYIIEHYLSANDPARAACVLQEIAENAIKRRFLSAIEQRNLNYAQIVELLGRLLEEHGMAGIEIMDFHLRFRSFEEVEALWAERERSEASHLFSDTCKAACSTGQDRFEEDLTTYESVINRLLEELLSVKKAENDFKEIKKLVAEGNHEEALAIANEMKEDEELTINAYELIVRDLLLKGNADSVIESLAKMQEWLEPSGLMGRVKEQRTIKAGMARLDLATLEERLEQARGILKKCIEQESLLTQEAMQLVAMLERVIAEKKPRGIYLKQESLLIQGTRQVIAMVSRVIAAKKVQ